MQRWPTGQPQVPSSAGTVWNSRAIEERVRRGPQEDLGQPNQSNLRRWSNLSDPQISNPQVLLTTMKRKKGREHVPGMSFAKNLTIE